LSLERGTFGAGFKSRGNIAEPASAEKTDGIGKKRSGKSFKNGKREKGHVHVTFFVFGKDSGDGKKSIEVQTGKKNKNRWDSWGS